MDRTSKTDVIVPPGISHNLKVVTDPPPHTVSDGLKDSIIDRSEAVQEIVSRKPSFIEKWALFMFLIILFTILTIAWLVKYPDIIETDGTLTSNNFPKQIVIVQEGRLKRLFYSNDDLIRKGEIIGWMESTADYQSVIKVKKQIDSCAKMLELSLINKAVHCFDNRGSNLGEVQKDYQQFINSMQLFKDYIANGYYIRKKGMLETDIQHIAEENKNIQREKLLGEQDLRIAEETFKMNMQLYEEHVTAEEEFRKAKSAYILKQMAVQQYDASLLSNRTRLNDKLKEIDQLSHEISQQYIVFEQSLQTFTSVVEEWMKRHLLISPMDGKITFVLPIQESQHFTQGKVVGFISPVTDQQLYIEMNLGQYNFGKIDTGMKAHLEFQAYPYQEFGYVKGTVAYISSIPSDSGFLATVRLDHGLVTNRNTVIPYKDRLKLHAKIITKDMRLLERLYYNMAKSIQ